ncbi:MAG: O-antigen ligase family protein [Betaproteobacteria bacterium]|nr:O-antigen ligase family protein [Betaproteobacteria bacterium]
MIGGHGSTRGFWRGAQRSTGPAREYSHSGSASMLDDWLYRLWIVALLWAPLPIGSVDAWALATLQAMVFGLLAAWCVGCMLGRLEVSKTFRAARWYVLLCVLWLGYGALYLIPLPLDWIAALSPRVATLHAETLALQPGARTLAIDLFAAQSHWLKSATYMAAFALTLLLVNTRKRVRQLAFTLVFLAFLISVYGIMMHLVGGRIDWLGTPMHHGAVAIGTYFNRNHFAGFLEITLALGIGLLIADTVDRNADSWKKRLRNVLEWIFSPKFRLRLMLCVLVIALVSTRSRMGNTAFFASLLITGIVGLVLSRHAPRGTMILLTSLIAIDLFIVGSWFGVEKLAQRLEQTTLAREVGKTPVPALAPGQEESLEQRQDAAVDTLPMIQDHLLLGVGPGGWAGSFLNYRGPMVAEGIFEHAHNDYAEFLAEYGVIGFVMLALMVLWALAMALRAQWVRRDPLMRGISFASLMGVLSILIHSWVDFNLQIPANALYFMVLLALGWISLHLDRRGARAGRSNGAG